MKLQNQGTGPFFTIADADWNTLAGAICIEMAFKMTDWTPSTDRILVSHGTTDGNIAWQIDVTQPNGDIRLSYFDLGTLASRISSSFVVPEPFRNEQIGGIRASLLSDFLGVASAYAVDFYYGGRWRYHGIQSAALVGTPFDSTENVEVGAGAGVESIYSFKVWRDNFGIGQIFRRTMDMDALTVPHREGVTNWTDRFGIPYTMDAAEWRQSDYPVPYAA